MKGTRASGRYAPLRPPLLSENCAVVLAASTIESTRLALDSLPPAVLAANRRVGSNLMADMRSDITGRIPAIPGLAAIATELEVAALLVRGTTTDGHEYHFQVTTSAGRGSDDNLFTSV